MMKSTVCVMLVGLGLGTFTAAPAAAGDFGIALSYAGSATCAPPAYYSYAPSAYYGGGAPAVVYRDYGPRVYYAPRPAYRHVYRSHRVYAPHYRHYKSHRYRPHYRSYNRGYGGEFYYGGRHRSFGGSFYYGR